ncbi:MAG: cation acetate symporter [Euzebyaceae bacterium]|nr:cation acetate symporter [Euzebyaceae bacterium]
MNSGDLTVLAVVVGVSVVLAVGLRPRGTSTLDFYLAGQRIGILTNACAICGDYFSAASFLGVAAAVYASGLDGVWYATGFAAGFVPVLLFVAAPLRRFGEFSIPDFLGRRLQSEPVRLCAVVVVELVILSYLVPQAVGSGITWQLLVGGGLGGLSPYATGVIVSTAAITAIVALGGMRGTTWTQAVQFLFLLATLLWLTAIALGSGFSYPGAVARLGEEPLRNPVQTDEGWVLRAEPNALHPDEPARFSQPGSRYGRFGQFALVVTLMLGTTGLPHVMNRFFTSPSGRAARMTTVWVLGFAGLFYALAVLLGTAARALIPGAVAGRPWLAAITVDGVLRVPEHALLVLGRLYGGSGGLGVIASGALVAVMSTIAGLLLAAAASWGHDVYERHVNPGATQRQAVLAGRVAVVVAAAASAAMALGLSPETVSSRFPSIVAQMVTWAFALAGSALTPVLLLTVWWRRTTAPAAVAGMVVGAVSSVALLAVGLAGGAQDEVARGLLVTPTLLAAPLGLLTTVVVSRLTAPPTDVDAAWIKLHGTAADRHAERLARLTIRGVAPDAAEVSR